MNYFYIIRNNKSFGPYDIQTLAGMVERGKILKCDKATEEDGVYRGQTVGDFFKAFGIKVSVKKQGSLKDSIVTIFKNVLLPRDDWRVSVWREDTRLLMLAAVGLLPMLLGFFSGTTFLTFYTISLYFSAIWGLFFYYLFKTKQVKLRTTYTVFFLTQAFIFIAWDVLGIVRINPCYWFENSSGWIYKLIYYIGGVGFTEELAKAIPLLILVSRAREPLIPQTLVFYGLISGIAFGVFEGVQYQTTVNARMEYGEGFMANIWRLTTLPFIHAIWCGIAGYFISFSSLYPVYRRGLLVLAIAIPAILHGTYDILCDINAWILRIVVMFGSVLILMTYLKRGKELQQTLSEMLSKEQ